MRTKRVRTPCGLAAFIVLGLIAAPVRLVVAQAPLQPVAPAPLAEATGDDMAAGRRLFDAQCALCHGIEGTGGSGPSLQRATLRHAADDETLVRVVRYGIPGTGMPAFVWQLSDGMAWQVAAYVRSLGNVAAEPLPGDPANGAAVYDANACDACHVVAGRGLAVGPELTEIGALRGGAYLREALVNPAAAVPQGHVTVRAIPSGGGEIRGVRLSEDVFWIHLRDVAGRLHSFRKSELKDLVREPGQSLMPAYESRLRPAELDDLVAYLASLRGAR